MKLTNTRAGYSETPLIKKLGIKEGAQIIIINKPKRYMDYLGELPAGVILKSRLSGKLDFIHFFSESKSELNKKFASLKKSLKPDGQIWVSWPKKSSKVQTDITEDTIRTIALMNGLVDIKVCAIDDKWSGLKLVYRLKNR